MTTQVFDNALDETTGKDVAKMLWLRSPSSEVWLERRTEYSRSLGLMSMVGYVRDFIKFIFLNFTIIFLLVKIFFFILIFADIY